MYHTPKLLSRVLLGMLLCIGLNAASQSLGDFLEAGNQYFNDGNFAKAADNYRKAIPLNNDNQVRADKLYFDLAFCEYKLKQLDKAIADYNSSINFNPNYAPAYWQRGVAYKDNNNYQLAINDFTKATEYFHEDPEQLAKLYTNISYSEWRLKHYLKAISADSVAIEANPQWGLAYLNRAECYRMTHKYELAIADNTTAISYLGKDKPHLCSAHIERSICERMLKQYPSALADCEAAMRINPEYKYIYSNKGYIYLATGDYELALDNLNRAIELFADDKYSETELYDSRAIVKSRLHWYDDAIRDDSAALAINPRYVSAIWNMSNVYNNEGEFQQAIDCIHKAIPFYVDNRIRSAELYTMLQRNYYELKNYAEVIKSGNDALALAHNLYQANYYMAKAYLKQDNKELASRNFKKVLSLDTSKKSMEYVFSLYYTGAAKQAIEIEKSSLSAKNTPYDEQILNYAMACLLSLTNDVQQGNSYLKKAVDAGYSKKYASEDEDLDNLRNTADYKAMFTEQAAN